MTAPSNTFTANELWTLWVAGYAAIVATVVFAWDVYKWAHTGAKLDVVVTQNKPTTNVSLVRDATKYTETAITNNGQQATSITEIGFIEYGSRWAAWLRMKPRKRHNYVHSMSTALSELPKELAVGARWVARTSQYKNIQAAMDSDATLYVQIVYDGEKRMKRIYLPKARREE